MIIAQNSTAFYVSGILCFDTSPHSTLFLLRWLPVINAVYFFFPVSSKVIGFYSPMAAFNIFCLSFIYCTLNMMYSNLSFWSCLVSVLWASWICVYPWFWKVLLVIITTNITSAVFSLSFPSGVAIMNATLLKLSWSS
jgi:hypothetical protein